MTALYYSYWFMYELMSEGFGLLMLQRNPSPEAFGATLRWGVLYAAAAAGLTTIGYNFLPLGLDEAAQTAIDCVFLGAPCCLYLTVLLRSLCGLRQRCVASREPGPGPGPGPVAAEGRHSRAGSLAEPSAAEAATSLAAAATGGGVVLKYSPSTPYVGISGGPGGRPPRACGFCPCAASSRCGSFLEGASRIIPETRPSFLPYATFSLSWRGVSLLLLAAGAYATQASAAINITRSLLTPVIIYATLLADSRHWRALADAALRSDDAFMLLVSGAGVGTSLAAAASAGAGGKGSSGADGRKRKGAGGGKGKGLLVPSSSSGIAASADGAAAAATGPMSFSKAKAALGLLSMAGPSSISGGTAADSLNPALAAASKEDRLVESEVPDAGPRRKGRAATVVPQTGSSSRSAATSDSAVTDGDDADADAGNDNDTASLATGPVAAPSQHAATAGASLVIITPSGEVKAVAHGRLGSTSVAAIAPSHLLERPTVPPSLGGPEVAVGDGEGLLRHDDDGDSHYYDDDGEGGDDADADGTAAAAPRSKSRAVSASDASPFASPGGKDRSLTQPLTRSEAPSSARILGLGWLSGSAGSGSGSRDGLSSSAAGADLADFASIRLPHRPSDQDEASLIAAFAAAGNGNGTGTGGGAAASGAGASEERSHGRSISFSGGAAIPGAVHARGRGRLRSTGLVVVDADGRPATASAAYASAAASAAASGVGMRRSHSTSGAIGLGADGATTAASSAGAAGAGHGHGHGHGRRGTEERIQFFLPPSPATAGSQWAAFWAGFGLGALMRCCGAGSGSSASGSTDGSGCCGLSGAGRRCRGAAGRVGTGPQAAHLHAGGGVAGAAGRRHGRAHSYEAPTLPLTGSGSGASHHEGGGISSSRASDPQLHAASSLLVRSLGPGDGAGAVHPTPTVPSATYQDVALPAPAPAASIHAYWGSSTGAGTAAHWDSRPASLAAARAASASGSAITSSGGRSRAPRSLSRIVGGPAGEPVSLTALATGAAHAPGSGAPAGAGERTGLLAAAALPGGVGDGSSVLLHSSVPVSASHYPGGIHPLALGLSRGSSNPAAAADKARPVTTGATACAGAGAVYLSRSRLQEAAAAGRPVPQTFRTGCIDEVRSGSTATHLKPATTGRSLAALAGGADGVGALAIGIAGTTAADADAAAGVAAEPDRDGDRDTFDHATEMDEDGEGDAFSTGFPAVDTTNDGRPACGALLCHLLSCGGRLLFLCPRNGAGSGGTHRRGQRADQLHHHAQHHYDEDDGDLESGYARLARSRQQAGRSFGISMSEGVAGTAYADAEGAGDGDGDGDESSSTGSNDAGIDALLMPNVGVDMRTHTKADKKANGGKGKSTTKSKGGGGAPGPHSSDAGPSGPSPFMPALSFYNSSPEAMAAALAHGHNPGQGAVDGEHAGAAAGADGGACAPPVPAAARGAAGAGKHTPGHGKGLSTDAARAAELHARIAGGQGAGVRGHKGALASHAAPQAATAPASLLIDCYALSVGPELDRGATSVVHAGRYAGRPVAVKVFRARSLDAEAVQFLHAEHKLSAALLHPNIVRYRGLCVVPPHISLVFDYCSRGSLYNMVERLLMERELYAEAFGWRALDAWGCTGQLLPPYCDPATCTLGSHPHPHPHPHRHTHAHAHPAAGGGIGAGGAAAPGAAGSSAAPHIHNPLLVRLADGAIVSPPPPPSLTWRRRLRMARDGAAALAYLHGLSPPICHRDVKSQNFLVTSRWTMRLGDFGESRAVSPIPPWEAAGAARAALAAAQRAAAAGATGAAPTASASGGAGSRASGGSSIVAGGGTGTSTTPGAAGLAGSAATAGGGGGAEPLTTEIGTVQWMAPEMLRCEPLYHGPSVDVFSFGIVLWELLTMAHPWEGVDVRDVIALVGTRGARPPIPPDCPRSYARLLRACWEEEPWRRPTAAAVLGKLERMLARLEAARHSAAAAAASGSVAAGAGPP